MKTGTLLLLLLFLQGGGGGNPLTRIAETNRLKEKAEEAFTAGRYSEAADHYEVLITKWGENSDAVRLNRAHALQQIQKETEATEAYRAIAEGEAGKAAKSRALQQLGFLAGQDEKKLQDAMQYFKEALKADPTNETARRNYELAWHRLQQQENNPEQEKEEDNPEKQPKIIPSEWAKQQKAKADALYQQFRYADALQLMQQSLQKDSTVAAYNDYMGRLGVITEIDQ